MTDEEIVEVILKKFEITLPWLFKQAYYYTEEPKEMWYITFKVEQYRELGMIPPEVSALCKRVYEDHSGLFK